MKTTLGPTTPLAHHASCTVEAGTLRFRCLDSRGIRHGMTFDNHVWGDMKLSASGVVDRYRRLLGGLGISTETFLYLVADHNDNVQVLTRQNLETYRFFNRHRTGDWESSDDLSVITLTADAVITKESLAMSVATADCNVVALHGVDRVDGRPFLAFVHVGLSGCVLGIHRKVMGLLDHAFQFAVDELVACVFPGIGKESYHKSTHDPYVQHLREDTAWRPFVTDGAGDTFGIDLTGKIVADLTAMGIPEPNCFRTSLDTYVEQKRERLQSRTFQKRHGLENRNSAVVISM